MVALASVFSNFPQLEVVSHTKPADLFYEKKSLTAHYFIVCKVCFQSVADATAFIILKDVFLQMINR